MPERQAMDIACDLFRRPLMARAVQKDALPPGMLEVIKVAAGEAPNRDGKLLPQALSGEQLRQAAVFFLQQALFQAQGDDFRLLGLGRDASRDQLRDHKRWLLKWLHPDRNPSKWESQLFLKVAQAAERLERSFAEMPAGERPEAPPPEQMPAAGMATSGGKHGLRPGLQRRQGVRSVSAARVPLVQVRKRRHWARRGAAAAVVAGLGLALWSYGQGRPLGDLLHDLWQGPSAWLSAAMN